MHPQHSRESRKREILIQYSGDKYWCVSGAGRTSNIQTGAHGWSRRWVKANRSLASAGFPGARLVRVNRQVEYSGRTIRWVGAREPACLVLSTHSSPPLILPTLWSRQQLRSMKMRPTKASDVAEVTRPGWLSWKDTHLDGKDSFLWRRGPEAVNETKPQTRKITIKRTYYHILYVFYCSRHSPPFSNDK